MYQVHCNLCGVFLCFYEKINIKSGCKTRVKFHDVYARDDPFTYVKICGLTSMSFKHI